MYVIYLNETLSNRNNFKSDTILTVTLLSLTKR